MNKLFVTSSSLHQQILTNRHMLTNEHPNISVELQARKCNPKSKKMWKSIHPKNFGSNMNLLLPISLHHRATNVKFHTFKLVWEAAPWYPTSMCNLADQSHMTILQARVSTHQDDMFFFLSHQLTNNFCQFITDCWLNSKWNFFVMVTILLFEVNYKFINKIFTFSLG